MRKFLILIVRTGFHGAKKLFVFGTLLSSAYIIFNSAVPYLLQKWVNLFFSGSGKVFAYKFGLLFALLTAAAVVSDYFGAYLLILLREKFRYSMRKNLLKEVINSENAFFAEKKSGYYTQVLMNDVEKASGVVVSFVYMVLPAVLGLPAAIFFSSLISPIFAVFGVLGFLLLLAIVYSSAKKIRKLSAERQEHYAKTGEKINELLGNALMIKIFDALNPVFLRNEGILKDLMRSSVKKNAYSYFVQVVTELVRDFVEILSVFFALIFATRLNITGAGVMAGVVYLSRIWQPVVLFQEINEEIQTAFASSERINRLISGNRYTEKCGPKVRKNISRIECKNVSLFYEGKKIAGNINFELSKGECLLVSGKSGIGKSTLARSILGVHKEFSGTILIDGHSVKEIPCVYSAVGYLPQFVPVLTDSLEFNIAFSEDFDKDKMNFAIKSAGLADFHNRLRSKREETISEKTVSGGERKRIGLARIFYRDYNAVILDEPLSGIDESTALELTENIKHRFKGKILIIISHNEHNFAFCNKTVRLRSFGKPDPE